MSGIRSKIISSRETTGKFRPRLQPDISMPHFSLPYIRFGRQSSVATGGEDYYTILSCSPDIPDSAVELFLRDVSKSIQWDTTGNGKKYTECFLLWRVTELSYWFARLGDAGRDSRNRPHAMEITALFVDASFLANVPDNVASFFTFLCHSSIWHSDFHGSTCEFSYEPEHDRSMESLENKIDTFINATQDSRIQSLFIAGHPHFISRGIDAVVYLNENSAKHDDTVTSFLTPENNAISNLSPLPPPVQMPTTIPSKSRIMSTILLAIIIVALFVGVITLGMFAGVTYLQNNDMAEELQQMERDHKQEIQLLKNQLDAQKQELKSKDRELNNAQRHSSGLEQHLAKVQEQLTQSRHNANRELQEQYEKLDTRYNNFYDEMIQLFKKWSPEKYQVHPGI